MTSDTQNIFSVDALSVENLRRLGPEGIRYNMKIQSNSRFTLKSDPSRL